MIPFQIGERVESADRFISGTYAGPAPHHLGYGLIDDQDLGICEIPENEIMAILPAE